MKWFCQGKYCATGVFIALLSQDEISDPFFHLIAAMSLDIQLSEVGKETSFDCLFGLENTSVITLKCPSSPLKANFLCPHFIKGEEPLQSSYMLLFCMMAKLFCNSQTFCGVRMLFSAHLFSELV